MYEDKVYKPIEEARSLKNVWNIEYLNTDPQYTLEILDYNYTTIQFCTKSSFTKINPPLEIYQIRDVIIDQGETTIQYKETKTKFNTFGSNIAKQCHTIDIKESLLGKIIKYGSDSTNITLSVGDNFEADLYMYDGYVSRTGSELKVRCYVGRTDYRAYMKFDISDIPSLATIDNATLHIHNHYGTDWNGNDLNITWHHVYGDVDYNFGTGGIDWQDQPCGEDFDDDTNCNLTSLTSRTYNSAHGAETFNITTSITVDHNDGNDLSYLVAKPNTCVGYEAAYFASIDSGTAENRPYVVIWYDEAATPEVSSTLTTPANNTLNTTGSVYHTANHIATNSQLENASIWTNITGAWALNQTDILSGTSDISNFTLSNIPDNTYYLWNVQACNNETNCTFASNNWTSRVIFPDTTPTAVAENLTNVSRSNNHIDVTWDDPVDTDLANILIYKDSVNIENVSNSTESYNYTGLASDTEYNLTIYTIDSNDNINDTITSENSILAKTEAGDTTAPIITIVHITNNTNATYTNTSILLRITTNEAATCRYNTSNSDYAAMTNFASTGATTHTQSISTSYGNTYTYYYRCNDTAGNNNTISEYHFFGVDNNVVPTVTLTSPGDGYTTTNDNLQVGYTPTDDHSSFANCSLYTNQTSWSAKQTDTTITSGSTNYFTITSLSNGDYLWGIHCADDLGLEAWSTTNRTFTINVSEAAETFFRFRSTSSEDIFTLNRITGYFTFPLSGGYIDGDLYVTGTVSMDDLDLHDLRLFGESDTEFAVGPMYTTISIERTGCATIQIFGNYVSNEDQVYLIEMNTSDGAEIGMARFSWSDDGTTNWDDTNVLTSTNSIDLNNGVEISFHGCSGDDFANGDQFSFLALEDPLRVFRIDTNGTKEISTNADWNFTGSDINMQSCTFNMNDTTFSNITVDGDTNSTSFTLNGTTINDWTDVVDTSQIAYKNESNIFTLNNTFEGNVSVSDTIIGLTWCENTSSNARCNFWNDTGFYIQG